MSVPVRASVVIPSYQSAGTIRACLRGVLSQHIDGSFEAIVVDSGSDGAAEIVRREFPTVRLLTSNGRIGAAPARNRGAREAHGAVLAFLDSDCVPGASWLASLIVPIERDECDGLGGSIRPVEGSNATAWAGYFCEFREFLPGSRAPVEARHLTPGNAAYRTSTFQAAGGFPDGFFPLEDQAFYEQLRKVGARIRFDPAIVVGHAHRDQVSAFVAHQARIGEANARVARALGIKGSAIAARPWLATLLLPFLATYRFCRTVAACWKEERHLMIRRPLVPILCWVGMFGWGAGFAGFWRSEYGDGDPGHRA